MFRQICCFSTAKAPLSDADLQSVIDSAVRYNGPQGVTGLLAYGGGQFFQVLEGPAQAIDDVLARLQSDVRLQNVRILRDVTEDKRHFAGWPMAYRGMDPEAGRIVSSMVPHSDQPLAVILAALGNPKRAADLAQLRLAA